MNTIVPVTDFVRSFGKYMDMLGELNEIIITRLGKPYAILKPVPIEKNKKLLDFFGIWKGTTLDDDRLWKDVLKRKNRTYTPSV